MEELFETTKDLMEFKTVKGNDEEFEEAFNYIREYFSGTDFLIKEYEKEGFKSIVIVREEDPEIILHGHIDVVEADEEMFSPEERDGEIHGRGSADMKSGLACLMKALKETKAPAGLLVTSDEEIGGFRGAKYLAENYYNPEFALSAEPNTEDKPEIIVKQKGIMRIWLKAEGEPAHGSKPWKGQNAAEKLWENFQEFKDSFNMNEEWSSTVNLGLMESGESMNIVPEKAEAGLDVRYTQNYPPEQIKEKLEELEISHEVEAQDPMLKTKPEENYVQQLREAGTEIVGEEVEIGRETAASDMRHFSQQEVPAAVFGPKGKDLHGKTELVDKQSIRRFYRIIRKFLEKQS
jgi:succinyl-diaminopimelate desuccinylase